MKRAPADPPTGWCRHRMVSPSSLTQRESPPREGSRSAAGRPPYVAGLCKQSLKLKRRWSDRGGTCGRRGLFARAKRFIALHRRPRGGVRGSRRRAPCGQMRWLREGHLWKVILSPQTSVMPARHRSLGRSRMCASAASALSAISVSRGSTGAPWAGALAIGAVSGARSRSEGALSVTRRSSSGATTADAFTSWSSSTD